MPLNSIFITRLSPIYFIHSKCRWNINLRASIFVVLGKVWSLLKRGTLMTLEQGQTC